MKNTCGDCKYLESGVITLSDGFCVSVFVCKLHKCVVSLDDGACQFFQDMFSEESEDDET